MEKIKRNFQKRLAEIPVKYSGDGVPVHSTTKKPKMQRIGKTADTFGEAILKVEEEKIEYLK